MVYKMVRVGPRGGATPYKTFLSTPPQPPTPRLSGLISIIEPFRLLTTDRRLVATETVNFVSRESQSQ